MDLQAYIGRFTKFRWPLFAALVLLPILGGCSGSLSPAIFVEQLILGLILGSVYALIALGYTLVYGVIKLINFAHGDIYMLGAFLGYYMLRLTYRWLHFEHGVSLLACFIISLVVSSTACAVLTVIMERLAYRPLRNSTRIAALITAVGVSFLLENGGIIIFGPSPKSYEPKTLAVYQLQTAADEGFSSPKTIEVVDTEQMEFPAQRFAEATYARVRLITKHGESDWGPTLHIEPGVKSGYVELENVPALSQDDPRPSTLATIGYRTMEKNGKELLALNWAKGKPSDVKLPSIFSNAEGKPLVFKLQVGPDQDSFVRLPVFYLIIIGVTLVLLVLLNILINKSMFGISMRALSFDRDAAKLMGVNTDLVIAQTFAIGGACAAVAGNLVGVYNQSIEPLMGILPGLKAFVAAVVGGIGSIPGAAVGGLIMGLSEAFVKGNISSDYSKYADAVAFAILILVLLFKPTGIFGRASKEKV